MGIAKHAGAQTLQHPAGVQPWGNYLFAQGKDVRNEGQAVSVMQDTVLTPDHLHFNGRHTPLNVSPSEQPKPSLKTALTAGLGKLKVLSDELMLQVLGLLSADSLARLACVNRAFYCFTSHEDLWRALALEV